MYNFTQWDEQVYSVTDLETGFRERLRKLREERDPFLSQAALGEALGVKQKVVSAWEVGDNNPTYDHLVQIARFYNVSIDWLLGTTSERQGKMRELSEEELRQRLFEYITPDRAPEILQHVARFFEGKD